MVEAHVPAEVKDKTDRVLSNRLIVLAFLVGLGLILVGFGVEIAFSPSSPETTAHDSNWLALIALFLKELGVAFLVAAIIGAAIEKQAKERDNQRAALLRREIAEDAIFAIYGIRHGRDFINAAIETNLQARVVREELTMDYRLRALTEAEAKLILPHASNDALQRFVILEMRHTYDLANVSSGEEQVHVRYSAPLREGTGARQITKVHFLRIDGETWTDDQINNGRLQGPADELFYEWLVPRALQPSQRVRVIIGARCVKERSDNEVWGCMFPTIGQVTLKLTVLEGMQFKVRTVSNSTPIEQDEEPDPVSKTWKMTGPLLRHNSIVFWWRIPEDGGEDTVSAPIEFSPESVTESSTPERLGLVGRFLRLISRTES